MDFKDMIISEITTIINAMKKLDETARKILFVENNKKLVGTVTDGDIRRWILKKGDLKSSVESVMKTNPITLSESRCDQAKDIMKQKRIEAIPVVDKDNQIKSVIFWNDIVKDEKRKENTPVVIMAGGKGTRLYPYTKILPKPLIPIGDIPIIERIINNFVEFGSKDFFLTVNHKKGMIKSYFNELNRDYNVQYVEEDEPLGTGGSLSMLSGIISETFFVSNCDILIDADYTDVLDFHTKQENKMTIVASLRETVIPYGVIELGDNGSMKKAVEKPTYSHLINTGMYVIEPELLDIIPKKTFYDLPTLAEKCINNGKKVGVYPVGQKSWLDMGQLEEMDNMLRHLGIKEA